MILRLDTNNIGLENSFQIWLFRVFTLISGMYFFQFQLKRFSPEFTSFSWNVPRFGRYEAPWNEQKKNNVNLSTDGVLLLLLSLLSLLLLLLLLLLFCPGAINLPMLGGSNLMEIYGFLFEGFARNKNVHGFGLEITSSPVVFVEDSFRITTTYNHPKPPRKLPSLFRNEQWKKPWLFGVYRGLYEPGYIGIIINH